MIDFNRDRSEGQLTPEERQSLYHFLLRTTSKTVCEVGTWKGGGSTYVIASALHILSEASGDVDRVLYSVEADQGRHEHALNLYMTDLLELRPFVTLMHGDSQVVYSELLQRLGMIDGVMLDGADEPTQAWQEYMMFRDHIRIGGFVVCHDWHGFKMRHLQPELEKDPVWRMHSLVHSLAIWVKQPSEGRDK